MTIRPEPPPPAPTAALELLLDGAAAAYGVAVTPEWRANALMHLRAIADAADLVLGAELGDEAEPAPVFRP